MGMRELVSLLSLASWHLVIVVWLLLALSWVCLSFVIVVLAFYKTLRIFRFGQNMLPARQLHTYWFVALCQIYVKCICMASHIYLTQTTRSMFFDNLFLKIPVQWLVTFLEFFDQILETFGMSTVD